MTNSQNVASEAPLSQGKRLSVRLSPEAADAVEEIMQRAGLTSIQDAIRRAISDELFLLRERDDNWKVLLQKESKYREVKWPDLPRKRAG